MANMNSSQELGHQKKNAKMTDEELSSCLKHPLSINHAQFQFGRDGSPGVQDQPLQQRSSPLCVSPPPHPTLIDFCFCVSGCGYAHVE